MSPWSVCQGQRAPLSYVHPCAEPLTLQNTNLLGLYIACIQVIFYSSKLSPLVSPITLSQIIIQMITMISPFFVCETYLYVCLSSIYPSTYLSIYHIYLSIDPSIDLSSIHLLLVFMDIQINTKKWITILAEMLK